MQGIADQIAEAEVDRDNMVRRIARTADDQVAALHEMELQRLIGHIAGLRQKATQAYKAVETVSYFASFFSETCSLLAEGRELTRDEKRRVLKSLGVRVFLYATKSDHFRETGNRWEFTANAEDES